MADRKDSALTVNTDPLAADRVRIIDDPGGTPQSETTTIANVVAYLVTTAGDIMYATASRTLARLGIGTAGQVLTVNSGATAVEWAASATGGTSFPVSPSTGDKYFRTDLGFECYWNGVDWVTVQEFSVNFEEAVYSATTNGDDVWIGDEYQPRFTRLEVRTFVDTTNTGTHYWTAIIRSIALDNTATSVSTISTAADSADVFVDHGEVADTAKPANYGGVFFRIVETDTPGDLTASATIFYRKIIT